MAAQEVAVKQVIAGEAWTMFNHSIMSVEKTKLNRLYEIRFVRDFVSSRCVYVEIRRRRSGYKCI